MIFAVPVATGATLPGSDVPRGDQLTGGTYVVWRNETLPWIDCGPSLRIPSAQTVVDLRTLTSHELPASAEAGSIDVSHLDRQGVAIGRRMTCDGTTTYGRVNLATGEFTDYATLAEAQPLPELSPACPACGQNGVAATYGFDFAHLVTGEALQLDPVGDEPPWEAKRFSVTRVDMMTGRTRTRNFDRAVMNELSEIGRAANCDLVWSSGNLPGTYAKPCSGRAIVRRWAYATGELSTTIVAQGGYLPPGAVARAVPACDGMIDPDSGRWYHTFKRDDYVTWQLKCGSPSGSRIRGCVPYTAVSGGTERCCIRVHDTATNQVRVLPPVRSGPWQRLVAVTPDVVVWDTTTQYRGDRVVGPLYFERLGRLRPAVAATSSRSRGGSITIGWRNFAVRYRTNIVMQVGVTSWGEPRFLYLTGLRRLGSGECRPPYDFRSGAPSGYDTCRPRMSGADEIAFADRPGRQRYFVHAGGFMSSAIVY